MWKTVFTYAVLAAYLVVVLVAVMLALRTGKEHQIIALAAIVQAVATCAIVYISKQTLDLNRENLQTRGTLAMIRHMISQVEV